MTDRKDDKPKAKKDASKSGSMLPARISTPSPLATSTTTAATEPTPRPAIKPAEPTPRPAIKPVEPTPRPAIKPAEPTPAITAADRTEPTPRSELKAEPTPRPEMTTPAKPSAPAESPAATPPLGTPRSAKFALPTPKRVATPPKGRPAFSFATSPTATVTAEPPQPPAPEPTPKPAPTPRPAAIAESKSDLDWSTDEPATAAPAQQPITAPLPLDRAIPDAPVDPKRSRSKSPTPPPAAPAKAKPVAGDLSTTGLSLEPAKAHARESAKAELPANEKSSAQLDSFLQEFAKPVVAQPRDTEFDDEEAPAVVPAPATAGRRGRTLAIVAGVAVLAIVGIVFALGRQSDKSAAKPAQKPAAVAAKSEPAPAVEQPKPAEQPKPTEPAPTQAAATEPPPVEPPPEPPTAKEPTAKEPTAKEPTAKEPTAKEPTAKEPTEAKPSGEDKKKGLLGGKKVVVEYDTQAREAKPVAGASADDQQAIAKARGHYSTGNQRLFAGDTAGAIRSYKRALAAYPAYVASYRGLGLAYAQKGDNAKAQQALHTYLSTAPGAKDAALIKKRLSMLNEKH